MISRKMEILYSKNPLIASLLVPTVRDDISKTFGLENLCVPTEDMEDIIRLV